MDLQSIEQSQQEQRVREQQRLRRDAEVKQSRLELQRHILEWQSLFDRIRELDAKAPALIARLDALNNERGLGFAMVTSNTYGDEVPIALRIALANVLDNSRLFRGLTTQPANRSAVALSSFVGA